MVLCEYFSYLYNRNFIQIKKIKNRKIFKRCAYQIFKKFTKRYKFFINKKLLKITVIRSRSKKIKKLNKNAKNINVTAAFLIAKKGIKIT